MEELGSAFWEGKRVLELGTGTGLGSVTAAKLGAARVLATDRDGKVLALAAQNARANGVGGTVSAASLSWGRPGPEAADSPLAQSWDVVIGADVTCAAAFAAALAAATLAAVAHATAAHAAAALAAAALARATTSYRQSNHLRRRPRRRRHRPRRRRPFRRRSPL